MKIVSSTLIASLVTRNACDIHIYKQANNYKIKINKLSKLFLIEFTLQNMFTK